MLGVGGVPGRADAQAGQLKEVHPTPSTKANEAADAAAAAAEAAVPFVLGRYGAAERSMEEAVKLSHGR